MSALRSQPLQPLNSGQLNARANNITPVKSIRRPKENVQPTDQKQKKKKEKLSALCKTPPSIVRTRNGRDYRRGNFWVKEGLLVVFK